MKTNILLILAALVMVFTACGAGSKKSSDMEKRTQVKIETTMGEIVVELYNETPKHRDNFIKLAKEGVYDSTLFHRVIRQFMIQAGDPESKNANDTAMLGSGDVGYTVPAEFMPQKFFHKRGALAMASYYKMEKSSGGHFYFVTGFKYSDTKLFNAEDAYNKRLRKEVFDSLTKPYSPQLREYTKDTKRNMAKIREIKKAISEETDKVMATRQQFHYTPEQRNLYKTLGGAADLDGYYTVFGEVIEGMDVVTKIEKRAVDAKLRPIDPVTIKKVREIEKPLW